MVLALVPRSEEWHEHRRQGIGASDVPAICGMSTYATPVDVWEQKTGRRGPTPDNAQMEWGRRLEPVIADAFAERTGIAIRRRSREVRYRDWPILFAHLDRSTPEGPLEVKTAMSSRGWGEDGSDVVPPHIGLQVQAQLLCADRSRGFVAALLGYRDFRVYEIARDDALLNNEILPILRDFHELVRTDTPPEPDGSESYSKFLRRMHPRDERGERPATPEEGLLVGRLLVARRERVSAQIREKELEQGVQAAIATDGGLLGNGWHITYRAAKDSAKVEWEKVARSLSSYADEETWGRALHDATEIKPGSRRFLVTVDEEEAE